jgi:hypothetical protein
MKFASSMVKKTTKSPYIQKPLAMCSVAVDDPFINPVD